MVDSAKGKAEDVRAGFDTLRVLVDAVDTQLGFFIREKGMFGPYRELIRSHALDIQTMLGVILLRSVTWRRSRASWCECLYIRGQKQKRTHNPWKPAEEAGDYEGNADF